MTRIKIRDLETEQTLEKELMNGVRGGGAWGTDPGEVSNSWLFPTGSDSLITSITFERGARAQVRRGALFAPPGTGRPAILTKTRLGRGGGSGRYGGWATYG